MSAPTISTPAIVGQEHWTQKGSIRLFLWAKHREPRGEAGTILFVHGSSMASTPTFDLQVPGRASAMSELMLRCLSERPYPSMSTHQVS